MTTPRELYNGKTKFISLVKRGANGDPIRVLKSEDGEGLDLSNPFGVEQKSDADELVEPVGNVLQVLALKADTSEVPAIIKKISLASMARGARELRGGYRAGTQAGNHLIDAVHARNIRTGQRAAQRFAAVYKPTRAGSLATRVGADAGMLARSTGYAGARLGQRLRNTSDSFRLGAAYGSGAARIERAGRNARGIVGRARQAAREFDNGIAGAVALGAGGRPALAGAYTGYYGQRAAQAAGDAVRGAREYVRGHYQNGQWVKPFYRNRGAN